MERMRPEVLAWRRPLRRAAAAAVLALAASACAPREGTPDAAYRAFARAAAEGDAERAWSLLSEEDQRWLDERAHAVAAVAPGVIAPGGRQLLLGPASRAVRPVTAAVVVRESRDRAMVEVEAGGARGPVELVREGGRWRVRLSQPAGAAAAGR